MALFAATVPASTTGSFAAPSVEEWLLAISATVADCWGGRNQLAFFLLATLVVSCFMVKLITTCQNILHADLY